ncbi:MAG: hypothetical protein A3K19_23370 [Lentisphaerae bacterium RIFOXYB12_FULL_65_16]|nr:MAG: hypothetical protein A3K18_26325 [Lentisphaerae bacterium RIFOXYA12_64_32]OGV87505.1 MAG: hypothetical protein A3K19_23370 [Lentisphaerae bacterium RIFOXYB12_FULL_65_16]
MKKSTMARLGWGWATGLLGLLLLGVAGAAENRITLVDKGKSDYVIVVAKDALQTPKFAAQELQSYIEKASGLKLPIVDQPAEGKKSIFVGESEFTQALGVQTDGVKPEGFLVRTVGDALVIIGKDTPGDPLNMHWKSGPQTGTLSGVDCFLEKYLGIRWFMPGELGEVVPKAETLAFGEINLREAPSFVNRSVHFWNRSNTDKEGYRWLRRNRVGRSLIVSHSHNWWYVIPCTPSPKGWPSWLEPRQPFTDHPEYYALVNGKRKMSHYTIGSSNVHGGQVCTTNPDVIRIFAETAIDGFQKHPDDPMFSISWNDGGGFCECDKCRALDVGTDAKGRPLVIDRLVVFYNAVGRLVYEKCPDKWLGAYVYYGGDLPKRSDVYQNICLWNPYNEVSTLFFNDDYRRKTYDQIRGWGRLCDNMFFYSAYHGSGFWGFPYSSTPILTDLFPFLESTGMRGVDFYGLEGWGGNGMDLYLACRLCWDVSLDTEVLVNDYYEKFYGPEIGAQIRAYHELLQNAARNLAGNTKMTDIGTLACAGQGMIEPMYGGIRPQARKMLDETFAAAPDGPVKERVRLVSDAFRLVELTLDALQAYKAVDKDASLENSVAFKKTVDAREQFLEAHKESLAISYQEVRACDENYGLPVKPQVAEHFLALKGKRKLAECRKAIRAPAIDGKLDDACWKDAALLADFGQKDLGTPAAFASEARLLSDEKTIYIGMTCKDPDPAHLLATITTRDGGVWDENELEIFFDTARDGKTVYQFLLNSIGTQCDVKTENGKGDMAWNGNWTVKTAVLPDGWSAEIAIPLADLGVATPVPGDIWRFNLCRVRHSTADSVVEYSAFSPTFGLFNRPDRFADLVFK